MAAFGYRFPIAGILFTPQNPAVLVLSSDGGFRVSEGHAEAAEMSGLY